MPRKPARMKTPPELLAQWPGLRITDRLNGVRISDLQKVFRQDDGKIFRRNGKRADLLSASRKRLYVNHLGKNIAASRLIWALLNGWVPVPDGKYVIDHIDHNRFNNDPVNLQLITAAENSTRSLHSSFQQAARGKPKLRPALASALLACLTSPQYQMLPPTPTRPNGDCLDGNSGLPRPERQAQALASAILADGACQVFFK